MFSNLFHLLLECVLLLAVPVTIWQIESWLKSPLNAPPQSIAGRQVRCQTLMQKDRLNGLLMQWQVGKHLRFSIRRENWFDRFCKALGLVREHHVGHADFDQSWYIEDPEAFAAACQHNPKIATWLTALERHLQSRSQTVRSIRCGSGRLILEIQLSEDSAGAEQKCAQWLEPLLATLAELPSTASGIDWQAKIRRLWTWLYLSAGMSFLLWMHFGDAHLVQSWPLIKAAAGLSTLCLAALLLWAKRRTSGDARWHRNVVLWLLIAWPSLWVLSAQTLRQINMHLDFSVGEIIAEGPASITTRRHRKHADTALVGFPEQTSVEPMQIGAITRMRLERRPEHLLRARLVQRSGALGFSWRELKI